MSIDKLQEKIRKLKCPLAVDLTIDPADIPPQLISEQADMLAAYELYTKQLLQSLDKVVPAVRFDFGSFAVLGALGLKCLEGVLSFARKQGFYVLLDGIDALSLQNAERLAEMLFADDCPLAFDGLITAAYIGSDGLQPYVKRMKSGGKDLFVVARTANRSAAETQDLLTGSRLAHVAKVDIVNRYTQELIGKSGYSQVAVMAAASSADSLRTLREKYKSMFLLLDGCDYPNANAKNCSYAFDRLGHGALACAGETITAAWREDDAPADYCAAAVAAAERLRKNLNRYITIL